MQNILQETKPRAWTADDGSIYPPIPWGKETNEWKGMARKFITCPGCGVNKGEFHVAGCEVEQIPAPLNARPLNPEEHETAKAFTPLTDALRFTFRTLDRGSLWIFQRWWRMVLFLIVFWLAVQAIN